MNIQICVPYYNPIHPATLESIEKARLDKEIHFTEEKEFGPYVGNNRNACVTKTAEIKQKLPDDIDYYLFVDSDIGFTVDNVKRLLEWKKNIISGAYIRRDTKKVAAGNWLKGNQGITGEHFNNENGGLVKADWISGGFLLVNATTLEKLPYPWFRHRLISNSVEAIETGEDIGFSILCAENKQELFIDLGCKVEHHEAVKASETIFSVTKTKKGFDTTENWKSCTPPEIAMVMGIIDAAKIALVVKTIIIEEGIKNAGYEKMKNAKS